MAEPLPSSRSRGSTARRGFMPSRSPRWGDSGPSTSPIARATRAWMRLRRTSSPTRRNQSGHPAP